VRGLQDNKENLAIVRAIISLAKNLGFSVTAEGIESLNQAQILKYFGCETLQGYYFSKPITIQEMLALSDKQWSIQALKPQEENHESN
jgi:EAL domain-containing protein (putative c-di-GMP-specific phosphodiesterase class I)